MSKFYTKALNLSMYLSKVYKTQGYEEFMKEFSRCIDLSLEGLDTNPEEVDRRLISLATGMSLSLFSDNRESIMQFIVHLPFQLKEDKPIDIKRKRFIDGFGMMVKTLEQSSRKFSERVIMLLKSYPLQKLNQLSVDILANQFQYSKSYFSRKFHEEQGHTIHDAITYEKLNRAFSLLSNANPRMNVKDVAQTVGFSDQKYFSSLFKENYGFSPSDIARLDEAIHRYPKQE